MAAREGVRSSARLSGAGSSGAPAPAAAPERGAAERAAAAELRRARAARAAERAREVEDSPAVLRDKCRRLARALRDAKHLVVYTGAGISTAADIPDYRGPRGVWTRLQRGETVGRVDVSRARPTFTHMALTALWARGALKFVVSQNCDGLHVRAGLPRRALAELHGDMFAERCAACRRVLLRAFDTTERTARHAHRTRRLCPAPRCGRELRDSIVHFGERGRASWPLNWAGALRHAAAADVVLCLGSSLKVLRRYPRLWRMQSAPHARPALYIVNLQWTPKDAVAALKINARCDDVMAQVASRLRLKVPRYRTKRDPLLAHAEPLLPQEAHTTRRPLLAVDSDEDSDSSYYSVSSASDEDEDSDDEVPLRRLAERLRDDRPSPPPPLHCFQVNLQSGETTILLRAEHAPTDLPPPEPPPPPRLLWPAPRLPPPAPRLPPPAPRPSPLHPALCPRTTTDALRRFRISRPQGTVATLNGVAHTNGHRPLGPEVDDVKVESPPAKIEKEEPNGEAPANGSWSLGSKLRRLLEFRPKIEAKHAGDAKSEAESSDEEATATLAAAIIRRAVLVCRAQLYPGLHTIIAPAAPPAAPPGAAGGGAGAGARRAECAWCLRRYAARRCLWYGAPRAEGAERRAWRRERGRRYLCACCGEGGEGPRAPAGAPDEGGWYGKGYRKGRRKRR